MAYQHPAGPFWEFVRSLDPNRMAGEGVDRRAEHFDDFEHPPPPPHFPGGHPPPPHHPGEHPPPPPDHPGEHHPPPPRHSFGTDDRFNPAAFFESFNPYGGEGPFGGEGPWGGAGPQGHGHGRHGHGGRRGRHGRRGDGPGHEDRRGASRSRSPPPERSGPPPAESGEEDGPSGPAPFGGPGPHRHGPRGFGGRHGPPRGGHRGGHHERRGSHPGSPDRERSGSPHGAVGEEGFEGNPRGPPPHGPHGHGPRGPHGPNGPHGFHGRGGRGGRGGHRGPPPFGNAGPFDLSSFIGALAQHPIAEAFQTYARGTGFGGAEDAQRSGETLVATTADENTFSPPIDIFSTATSYILHVALPGAKKEDVGVNWDAEKSELNIAGVIYRQGDEEFLKSLSKAERKVGVFERSLKLPLKDDKEEIDGDSISAKLEDGVLVVTVPKVEKEWTDVKKIDIV